MKNNLWGHALFLASKMDSRAHANVMTRYIVIKIEGVRDWKCDGHQLIGESEEKTCLKYLPLDFLVSKIKLEKIYRFL